ncbi:MAG TPA: hypothetical protein VFK51_01750 [Burkholderiales bacterium]|jgi:hypothetical protein|nr:hypothetical protein [Burkholderiales bacterium]
MYALDRLTDAVTPLHWVQSPESVESPPKPPDWPYPQALPDPSPIGEPPAKTPVHSRPAVGAARFLPCGNDMRSALRRQNRQQRGGGRLRRQG